jgi:hypothetical protein
MSQPAWWTTDSGLAGFGPHEANETAIAAVTLAAVVVTAWGQVAMRKPGIHANTSRQVSG